MKDGHFTGCNLNNESSCWCEIKRYSLIIFLSIFIFAAEVVGGIISGSLALLSDAGHVLVDSAATFISIIIAYLVKKNTSKERSIRIYGTYINATILGVFAIWVFVEAMNRFKHPQEVMSGLMLGVSLLGAILNYIQHRILETVHKNDHHLTHKGMSLHVLSDLWQSIAVIIASIAISITGRSVIDPILSIIVSIVMTQWALVLFRAAYKQSLVK